MLKSGQLLYIYWSCKLTTFYVEHPNRPCLLQMDYVDFACDMLVLGSYLNFAVIIKFGCQYCGEVNEAWMIDVSNDSVDVMSACVGWVFYINTVYGWWDDLGHVQTWWNSTQLCVGVVSKLLILSSVWQ